MAIAADEGSVEERRSWQSGALEPALSSRTTRLTSYVESRRDWPDAKRLVHLSQAADVFERSLAITAGPASGGEIAGTADEPFGILFTGISARETSWRLGNPVLQEAPALRLQALTEHSRRVDEAVKLGEGHRIVVDGAHLEPGDEGAFLVAKGERFDPDTDEVFVIRRVDAFSECGPEELSARGLYVDAWLRKLLENGPADELAEFLCLFVIAPMVLAFQDFDRARIENSKVRAEWKFFSDKHAAWRDELLSYLTAREEEWQPSP
jgi:hypothetical protein